MPDDASGTIGAMEATFSRRPDGAASYAEEGNTAAGRTAYDAFISYSHAKDRLIAAALQRVLQKLGKPWYRRRGARLFRDDTNLAATPYLWPAIEKALEDSRFLILLASPEAAKPDGGVDRELIWWLANKGPDTVIIALTDGELSWDHRARDFGWSSSTPLPQSLKGRLTTEPLWIDLRRYRHRIRPRDEFKKEAARISARIHHVPFDELWSDEAHQNRRAKLLRISVAAALVSAIGFAYWEYNLNSSLFEAVQLLKIRIEEALRKPDPRPSPDADQQKARAESLDKEGDKWRRRGDRKAALASYKQASELRQSLANDDESWRELALTFNKIGGVERQLGKLDNALKSYDQVRKIREGLARDDGSRRELSLTFNKLGEVLEAKGGAYLDEALAHYIAARDIRTQLADTDLMNPTWQHDLAESYGHIGIVKSLQNKPDDAWSAFQQGLDIIIRLKNADRQNTTLPGEAQWFEDRLGDMKRMVTEKSPM